MVKGLDKFKEYFNGYETNYVVIGGTACEVILTAAALTPRATKDIDIVLVVEALSKEFVKRFWEFIEAGEYGSKEKSADERKHYRFKDPAHEGFPLQIELFSRVPDLIDINKEAHLTPIPAGEDLSSLSAILMNDDYYRLTVALSKTEGGLKRASSESLICLKAKAFLEMTHRKKNGGTSSDREIKKHKNDVFRMALMLTEESRIELVPALIQDMIEFIEAVRNDLPGQDLFNELGVSNVKPEELLAQLELTFGLQKGRSYLDRQIDELKKRLNTPDQASKRLDFETARSLILDGIIPLFREFESKVEQLKDLFIEYDRTMMVNIGGVHVDAAGKHSTIEQVQNTIISQVSRNDPKLLSGIDYTYQLRGFKKSLTHQYFNSWLHFQFNEFSYSIRINQDHQKAKNYSYDAPLDQAEIEAIVKNLIETLIRQISEAGGLKG